MRRKVMPSRTLALSLTFLFALFGLWGCTSNEGQANRLLKEAVELAVKARLVARSDFQKRARLYEQAHQKLTTILRKYPSTPAAVGLSGGKITIDSNTWPQFQKVVRLARIRAQAVRSPLIAVWLVAQKVIKNASDRADTWPCLAAALAKHGHRSLALHIVKRSRPYLPKLKSDPLEPYGKGFSAFVYWMAGRKDMARQMVKGDKKATAFSLELAMTYLAEKGRIKQALEMVSSLQDPETRAGALITVALQRAAYGQDDQAYQLLEPALSAVRLIKYNGPRALELAQIGISMAEIGRKKMAIETLAEADRLVGSLAKPIDQVQVLADLARIHLTLGQKQPALGLLDRASKILAKIDPQKVRKRPWRITALGLAGAYGRAGEPNKGLKIVMALGDSSRRDWVYQETAEYYAVQGDLEKATFWLEKIKNRFKRTIALIQTSLQFHRQGNPKKALVLLDRAGQVKGSPLTNSTLKARLASAYAKLGKQVQANLVIVKLLKSVFGPSRKGPDIEKDLSIMQIGMTYSAGGLKIVDDPRIRAALKEFVMQFRP
jgi:tetratricopeptide (TPR) repeat protein